MRIKIIAVICVVALAFSMCACGVEQPVSSEGTVNPISSDLPYANQIITNEQMLADYDAMWNAMKESYPFWRVLARSKPDEPDHYTKIIADYRRQIEVMEATGDDAMYNFLSTVAYSLYDVCGMVGHVSIINPNYFRDMDVYKKYIDEMPEVQPWVDVINKPEVISFYEYYDYLLTLPMEDAGSEEANDEEVNNQPNIESEAVQENLTMEILEEGKIAYIKINSFDDTFMAGDLPQIHNFLEKVKDYKHLIIDIQENGGGNTVYWEDAFVRPNITEPVNSRLVRLMKDTELTQQFYGSEYTSSNINMEQVKKDLKFAKLPKEDAEELTLAREILMTLEPKTDKKLFDGEKWVLIGPEVYSSSEAFAVFCKDTGFATLVGQTTGGSDSGGPILFELPNSHLLIQFDVEYCLNADGSCNQEMGTVPDIESADALQAVLDLIS